MGNLSLELLPHLTKKLLTSPGLSVLRLPSHSLKLLDHATQPHQVLVKSRSYLTHEWEIQNELVNWTQPNTPDLRHRNDCGISQIQNPRRLHLSFSIAKCRTFLEFPLWKLLSRACYSQLSKHQMCLLVTVMNWLLCWGC